MLTMKGIPKRKQKPKTVPKVVIWNTNKEGGWGKYNKATNNNPVLNKIANYNVDESNPNTVAKQIEKELTNVMIHMKNQN